jgi:Acetyltransferase (isoleucine patch superfamily)
VLKRLLQGAALLLEFAPALCCGFGHVTVLYTFLAHCHALLPAFVGNFARSAFYKLTLRSCSIDTVIAFGTFFSQREADVGPNVSIGSYCVIGRARIGARTQISSHVEIPSGRHEHVRNQAGQFEEFSAGASVTIGSDCWIGAAATILADVGDRSTIGAGSVVVKPIPADVVAVGNPAKSIRVNTTGQVS